MRTKIIAIATCTIFLIVSCYKDQGNYEYLPIEEIAINGINENYSGYSLEETISIVPNIDTKIDEKNLEYLWMVYPKQNSTVAEIDTIGDKKDLNYSLNIPQGDYILTFQVKNKTNNYIVSKSTNLQSTTRFARGFYVLKETNIGETDLDLHINDMNKAEDLIIRTEGHSMPGKPTNLGINFGYSFIDNKVQKMVGGKVIVPMTTLEARTLRINDMQQIYGYQDMFFEDKNTNEVPYFFNRIGYTTYMVTSQGIYSTVSMPEFGLYTSGKFGIATQPAGISPYIVKCQQASSLFYFDSSGKRFLATDRNGAIHEFSDDGKIATPNQIPHSCLFMGSFHHSSIGSRITAIFQSNTDINQRLLYSINYKNSNFSNPIEKVITLREDLASSKASRYATNGKDVRILYSVSSKNEIYAYNIDTEQEIKLTPDSFPLDEEVTYIAHKYWNGANDATNRFNYLVLATFKDGRYRLFLYNMLGGQPTGAPAMVLEGKGKVKDVQYALPTFDYSKDEINYM
ncbi:PKD-like family lipoprotein [Sphingobacterium faecale]|uniref:PKD family protein n=1 Tax=Sphingobacterium faecale TaxID=2803775 RepID=A0ABS1R5Q5_9SPHI|nr:PKD-like family lipoprotein [Sphingobacterium faecale]MBL1410037.1 hypothetical protein [Sphingobacterium faecale]